MKQTAVSLLKETLDSEIKSGTKMVVNWDMYLEMEKQQMFGFTNHHHVIGEGTERFFKEEFELWYNETYGSKGSNEYPLTEGTMAICNDIISSQTEISDENAYTNGYLHGYNAAIAELPKEISDEEIEKYAKQNAFQYYEFITGAKWYRDQLKQR